ncbi:hypothetical protein BLN97_10815 [Bradyrhizobium elkanii]|nr:hypothetical protein BLN97_10815 [Bradyrhizobium elkanii]
MSAYSAKADAQYASDVTVRAPSRYQFGNLAFASGEAVAVSASPQQGRSDEWLHNVEQHFLSIVEICFSVPSPDSKITQIAVALIKHVDINAPLKRVALEEVVVELGPGQVASIHDIIDYRGSSRRS